MTPLLQLLICILIGMAGAMLVLAVSFHHEYRAETDRAAAVEVKVRRRSAIRLACILLGAAVVFVLLGVFVL